MNAVMGSRRASEVAEGVLRRLGSYGRRMGYSHVNYHDRGFESAVSGVYDLLASGASETEVGELLTTKDFHVKPLVNEAISAAGSRLHRENVVGNYLRIAGNGFLEYKRREGDDDFDKPAEALLKSEIIGAVSGMAKHGLTSQRILLEIRGYLGKEWDPALHAVIRELVNAGVASRRATTPEKE